jgi:uncharacterized protein YdaU (DUF1376 family)
MPLYWGDYLRDTGHLDATQHGFYLLLIGHYWTTGRPLPNDDSELWRIVRADSIGHWRKHRRKIEAFFKVADGFWRHARIDEELTLAVERRRSAKERAEKAARTRWERDKQSSGNAPSIPAECPPSPSPSPSGEPLQGSPPMVVETSSPVAARATEPLEGQHARDNADGMDIPLRLRRIPA